MSKILTIGAIALFTIIVIVPYYSNVKAIIKDVCSFVAGIRPYLKRNKIKSVVENSCQSTINDMNQTTPELNLPEMTLRWVQKDDNGKVLLEEGKAIVLLTYDRDNIKNIINTTTAYVRKALLPTARNFLATSVRKAIDYTVIRQFISNSLSHNIVSTTFVSENLDDIHNYQDTFHKVATVDEEGMLSRMLLREYSLWGNRIVTHLPSPEYAKESTDFLDFLYDLLSREPEELSPLQFIRNNIKVGVLLVAKYDTYSTYGLLPYLRRIREGFASGIRSFYLLARNDKIEILEQVYSELVATGNFVLQNGPKVFKDSKNRDNICYCIEVNPQGSMAKDYTAMNDFIVSGQEIELVIERVYPKELKCLYNLIPVVIPLEQISDKSDIRLSNYYVKGMTINAHPLELLSQGVVKASLLNTDSNPQKMIDLNYVVGTIVTCVVQEADDMFVNMLVKDSSQKAVAYRRNLTYSRNQFLHQLFPVGSEREFVIIGVDYVRNRIEVRLKDLIDPWDTQTYQSGQKVQFTIFREEDSCFVSELEDGIDAILPYSNLTWMIDKVDEERRKYRRNQMVEGYVKSVEKDRRVVILTLRSSTSPYEDYYNIIIARGKEVKVLFESNNSYGIIGKAEGFRVFVPLSETHVDDIFYPYQIGNSYTVRIKEVAPDGLSLIGSLIPYIETPLQKYAQYHKLGDLIKLNSPVSVSDKHIVYNLYDDSGKERIKATLFIGDISRHCRIDNLLDLVSAIPLDLFVIKRYDFERNKVELSLCQYLSDNLKRIKKTLLYDGESYEGVVIGQHKGFYYLIILDMMIEGKLQMTNIHKPGNKLRVYLASNNTDLPEFYE